MADTLSADLHASLAWLLQEDRPFAAVIDSSRLEYAQSLSDGTGAGQADRLWYDERTLAGSTSEDLDLTALPQSLFNNSLSISMARVRAILVVNLATSGPAVLQLGGAGAGGAAFSGPFAGNADARAEIPDGSALLLTNLGGGWPVVDTTADVLRVTNTSASSVSYRIAVVGTSA